MRLEEISQSTSSSSHSFLCFGGRFRLSGITRVTAGAIPDLRATRRASFPTSMIFFFRFFISLQRLAQPRSRRKHTAFASLSLAYANFRLSKSVEPLKVEQRLQIDSPVRRG